jgi:hypothetical protein
MQTLVSVFDDRNAARRAVERLVQAGVEREDIHVEESPARTATATTTATTTADDAENRQIGERTMDTAEREVAVDRDALEAVGHFFVSLFGLDHPDTPRFSKAIKNGRSVVVVDALDDDQADACAVMLHDAGACEVDDDHGKDSARVRKLRRDSQPPLRELVAQRQMDDVPH